MPTRTLARSIAALVALGAVATPIAIAVAPSAHPAAIFPAASSIPDNPNPALDPQGDAIATAALGGIVPGYLTPALGGIVPDWVNPALDPQS